jgi:DNA-binding IclR family transcriptional regulator
VFLAFMDSDQRNTYLEDKLDGFTEHTIVDSHKLADQLAIVRRDGYACSIEEQEVGLVALAAPIRELAGHVIAALAVSGPAFRITHKEIPVLAERLVAAAAQISQRNGYPKAG